MNYIFETERLKLRELTLGDTTFIVELVNSPGWLKYIGDRNIKTVEQAKAYLENGPIKSYKENKFGLWLVETKENKKPMATLSLAKDQLKISSICAITMPTNNASIKLLEKIGMKSMKSIYPGGSDEELLLYQVSFYSN
jgi:RimJ/RimL family protein N-acetyltransferase